MSETSHAKPGLGRIDETLDNPLERLRLLAGDDDAIAAFLDELDVSSPREREMLAELARPGPLARPERFDADHRRLIEALESLRRHGFHGSRSGSSLGPFRVVVGDHEVLEEVAPKGCRHEGAADATGADDEDSHRRSLADRGAWCPRTMQR